MNTEIKKKGYTDRQRITDYRATFNTPEGVRVLNDLIFRHYILESTVNIHAVNMAHMEGQRDVVLGILNFMQLKPDDIPQRRVSVLEQFAREDDDGVPSNR
jgi:hypothetical protein